MSEPTTPNQTAPNQTAPDQAGPNQAGPETLADANPPRELRSAVVVGGNRIPFARTGGAYAHISNRDMLIAALEGLVARFGLQGERVGAVAAGAVLKHSKDFNLTREAVLGSPLAHDTVAYDVQQACATGLEAVIGIANKIKVGQIESGIAGGVDSASDAPIVVSERLRRILLDLSRAKTFQQKLTVLSRVRPKDLAPVAPTTSEPRTGLSMGEQQALTTAKWNISREAQDEVALASHHKLAAAYERNFFDDLMTPYHGMTRDGNLRPDTSMEKLGKLQPVFGKGLSEPATMTAGNSTPLTDGAALVLLASEEYATHHSLPLLARVVDAEAAAVDFVNGEEGLLMAPVYALPRLLARNGLGLQDFDFYEIHEAFASTVLTQTAAWASDEFCKGKLGLDAALGTIDRDRLNVTGSSLAAGHPFAATGGRIVATLAKLLHERAEQERTEGKPERPIRGLISVCAAGGQGVTMILEAL